MSCNTRSGDIRCPEPVAFGRILPFELRIFRSLSCPRPFTSTVIAIFLFVSCISAAFGQTAVLTQHYDNARTGQNTHETILTRAKVNPRQFGKLFTKNLDGQEAGQPLYVPAVFIPAANSAHNVVYVATQHDSVYAFDAESNQGSNAPPLWQVNFVDLADGITTVPLADEQCYVTGYTEFGIQGTPVIDVTRNAIYVLAMTKENGAYVHKLHSLDLGTGAELFGGPVTISASVTINNQLFRFIDRYQQQRPGLLLQGGIVYIGFGSPGCNSKTEMGWVMAYDGGTLKQVGVFNDSPGVGASAIWMSGAGLAGDGAGNVYFSTGDGLFDADTGGSHYGDSVLKLSQGSGVLNLADYFAPYNQGYLRTNDLDLSAGQVLLLPEVLAGKFTLAVDKNGTMYLLDQDNLGQFNPFGDTQIPQEEAAPVSGEVHAGLTYWNDTVYVAADQTPVMAYSFTNGQLSLQPISQAPMATASPTAGIVSSNAESDGIFWYVASPTRKLFAFDATNLAVELYDNAMAGSRDALGPEVHFEMPIVADGRVYVNGQTQLTVFGLLPVIGAAGGNNQTGAAGTTLPIALQAAPHDPYTGKPILTPGIPVTFTASGKVGSFSNPTAVTDNSGIATTSYTLPAKAGTYTITASSPGYASAIFVVTGKTGSPATFAINSGSSQKAPVASLLPLPLKVRVKDAAGNGVAGILVSFSDAGAGGTLSSPTATTDSSGFASTSYTTGKKSGVVAITASVAGLTPVIFKETVLAGPAASLSLYSGNNQTVKAGTATTKLLQVIVKDQYGNPVAGISVSFNDGDSGGSFLPDPVATSSSGIAGTRFTAPTEIGAVNVTASSAGLGSVLLTVNVN
jgi:Bacterial Ig-like domain (group 1)/Invasin, domain 3